MLRQHKLYLFVFPALLLSLFLSVSLSLYSCLTKEQQEWNNIKNSVYIEDIFDFAEKYKDSEYTDLLTQANNIITDYIADEEDAEILKELVNKYPEWEKVLKDRITEISYNETDDLEKFIAEFENYGADEKYVIEAKKKLKNLYFATAKEAKSIELFEEFIAKYENEDPAMTEEAHRLIDDIQWENALGKNTRKDYADYIDASMSVYGGKYGKYIDEANKKIEDCDWIDAYEKSTAQSNETLLPILNFIETYPDSDHIPEAELLLETMRNDSWIYERYAARRTLDAIEEFIANFPGHIDIETAEARKSIYEGNIYDFAEKGYIQVKSAGKSIQEITLTIKNITTSQIIINIPIGVYFAANSGNVQNMAVTEEASFKMTSLEEIIMTVRVACMNIARDIPSEEDSFMPQLIDSGSPLTTLLKILNENGASYEVAQTAIWYVQDNPGRQALLTTLVNQDTGEYAITESDYNEALRIAEQALAEFAQAQSQAAQIEETTD